MRTALLFFASLCLLAATALAQSRKQRTPQKPLPRIEEDILDDLMEDADGDWLLITASSRQRFLYHKNRIIIENGIIKTWIKEKLKPNRAVNLRWLMEQRRKMFEPLLADIRKQPGNHDQSIDRWLSKYPSYSHTLAQWEFNCKNHTYRARGTVDYDKDGNVLYSMIDVETRWESAVPDSIGEGLLDFMCKKDPLGLERYLDPQ